MMSEAFALTVNLDVPFDTALDLVTDALMGEGFGVLTTIDVKETLKKKLGEEFRPYVILGACNPPLAHRALSNVPEVGIMLPCNVTVEQRDSGVLVSIVNPEAMMTMGDLGENEALREVAVEVRSKLERVAENLKS
jgi:uncharacterized protein (DUF302 family)